VSHTTKFAAPGWAQAVLIHDGYGMPGTPELRAWLDAGQDPGVDEPDFAARLHADGRVEVQAAFSDDGSEQKTLDLLYRAGMVVGASRLEAAVVGVIGQRSK
jgi:hypothetical protein